MRRLWFVVIVAGIAAVIVLIGTFSLNPSRIQSIVDEVVKQADDPIKAHYRQFQAKKALWQANVIVHYRLRVVHGRVGDPDRCERDVEVKDEQVQQVFKETCAPTIGVATVTDLFTTF